MSNTFGKIKQLKSNWSISYTLEGLHLVFKLAVLSKKLLQLRITCTIIGSIVGYNTIL